jgi:hypothetical protein
VIGKGKEPLLKGTIAKKDGFFVKNIKKVKNLICKPGAKNNME